MRKLSFRSQFRIGAGIILFFFCIGGTLLVYNYQKVQLSKSIYKETEIYIALVDAIRTYVKDVLRPKMYELLPRDHFIPEGMSTSFVGREIMKRLHSRFSDFVYRRAAPNPINPANKADTFESGMINWFKENPNSNEWSGIIEKRGHAYYVRLRKIVAEKGCLNCHGDPKNAPRELIARYGLNRGGYGYRVGQIVAEDAIYIPVEVAYLTIERQAWMTFFVGGLALLTLSVLFYYLFNRTVISELQGLLTTFKGIIDKKEELEKDPADSRPPRPDEIGQLKEAFETAALELKEAHDDLTKSELKYRRLFEASQDAIFIWDNSKKLVDINEAGVRMFGLKDKGEALSMESMKQLFWDARDSDQLLELINRKGSVKDHEVSMVDRSGKRLDVMITANLHLDERGNPNGFEGVMRDVTEKKRMEQYLAQTEKLASIGELAAGVAHEINNPLGVIVCYANLIKKNIDHDSEAHSDLEIIQKHTKNCKRIVEALLDFARATETTKMKVDIHSNIEEVTAVLERQLDKEGISIQRNYADNLPLATIDPNKMKQVYVNLLMNAKDAVKGGGKITIDTSFDRDKRNVSIRVSDTGSGIPQEIRDRIFDPFFTTKRDKKGTGLGLSVSYGIVKEHGGDILVRSTPEGGAEFTIMLPLSDISD